MLKRVPVSIGAVLVLGLGALSGCGGGDASAASTPSATPTTASASPSPTQSSSPRAKAKKHKKAKRPRGTKDPLAPSTIKPVTRNGKVPHPSVSASPAPLTGVVTYGDGVTLDITGISQGRVTGKGPGVVQGPKTSFSLSLANGGSRSLDLSSVVVTAVHGKPARIANPIYDKQSQDFAGNIKPGSRAKARYTFSIPVNRRSNVTIHVDFDAVHTAAVFTGTVG